MKRLPGLFLLFIFAANVYASTLIFKSTKEVKRADIDNFAELATVDVSKYKQVRIILKRSNFDNGETVQVEGFQVFAVEGSEEIFFHGASGYSAVIDSPPSIIRIKVYQTGLYKIYVWGTQ